MYKIIFLVLLVFSWVASAAASPVQVDGVLAMEGTIESVEGHHLILANREGRLALLLGWQTVAVNGKSGRQVALDLLQPGDELTAYYSPALTRSIPPQTKAYALVLGTSEHRAFYLRAGQVDKTEDGVRVLDSNGAVSVHISRAVCAEADDIQPGTELLAWYDVVTMSLPGQAEAWKARVLY